MDRVRFSPAFAVCLFLASAASADTLRWKDDYKSARRESVEKKRPMFIDVGTEACTYCRKLDATTFRDPAVGRALNDSFVAVRVDAEREPRLAAGLKVNSYPTLIVAGADGEVLGFHAGYLDPEGLRRFLKDALAKAGESKPAEETETPSIAGGYVPPMLVPVKAAPSPGDRSRLVLDVAERDLADGYSLACLERCLKVIRENPGSTEETRARRLMAELKPDPELLKAIDRAAGELASRKKPAEPVAMRP